MCGKAAAVAGERDVDKIFHISQLTYGTENARLKVIPSKRVLLLSASRWGRRSRHGVRPLENDPRCYRAHTRCVARALYSRTTLHLHQSFFVYTHASYSLSVLCIPWRSSTQSRPNLIAKLKLWRITWSQRSTIVRCFETVVTDRHRFLFTACSFQRYCYQKWKPRNES